MYWMLGGSQLFLMLTFCLRYWNTKIYFDKVACDNFWVESNCCLSYFKIWQQVFDIFNFGNCSFKKVFEGWFCKHLFAVYLFWFFLKVNVSLTIALTNREPTIKYLIYLPYYTKICTLIDSIERIYKPTNHSCADIPTSGYFLLRNHCIMYGFKRYSSVIEGGYYK